LRPPFGPTQERDACGIGFVADSRGRASREIVDTLLEGLHNVRHRGATAGDRKTGDGAGVLLPLAEGSPGVAMVFLRDETARGAIEDACRAEGIEPLEWREVPVDTDALGANALASMPRIEQLYLRGGDETRAYRARRRAERTPGAYIASLSFRTVTYKALCAAEELGRFYTDLSDPSLAVPFGIFHQRFSTNTEPSWERAQPFRLLCHNGEINAIQGNVNWMRAREGNFGSDDDELLHPVCDESGSDSAMLDNALELLVRYGRDVRHALTMLVPEAWDGNPELDPKLRDYYRYHSLLVEPWDGPAGLVFTDGSVVGAALDRNGLRPLRYAACSDGLVVCASEAGAVDLSGRGSVRRGRLGPGEMIAVDPVRGFEENAEVKRRLARMQPYGRWLADGLRRGSNGTPVDPPSEELTRRQATFGYTREDVNMILRPVAGRAHEPTSSMGDDTGAASARRARPPLSTRTFASDSRR
jgi:glutamate synthase (ferredoxin)